ncbi:MAG: LytTR family DNA-binding domain-containing protein [Cytophagales bacterium]|nr:LytTR family DNA-binding domain-containing protein [Cytophagales bacterium]
MRKTVLIADDEEDARELLKVHLKRHDHLSLVAEAQNGQEALEAIQKWKPDIILLDIQMPELSGIELVEQLKETAPPQIIFVTAYDQFAVKAFELNAVDYLLKPFSKDRFDQTLNKVTNATEKQDLQMLMATLSHTIPKKEYLARFAFRDGPSTLFIPTNEVSMIISADQYVEVFTTEKKYLIRLAMDYLEQVLDPAVFFRTHRSYFVNINFVTSIEQYEPRNFLVHLQGDLQAKLSRDKRDAFNLKLSGHV